MTLVIVPCNQCDQMVKLCFNIWPLATMKLLPSNVTNLPEKVYYFAKSEINRQKVSCQRLENFAIVAKFGQIWSHCRPRGRQSINHRLIHSSPLSLLFRFCRSGSRPFPEWATPFLLFCLRPRWLLLRLF